MYTCIYTYIRTCIHKYLQKFIHMYLHANMPACTHASIHTSMHIHVHTHFMHVCNICTQHHAQKLRESEKGALEIEGVCSSWAMHMHANLIQTCLARVIDTHQSTSFACLVVHYKWMHAHKNSQTTQTWNACTHKTRRLQDGQNFQIEAQYIRS